MLEQTVGGMIMKKTKIEWCDSTWNPVTGCLHGCEYCYARKIANRFGTLYKYGIEPEDEGLTFDMLDAERFCELNEPERNGKGKIEPYPANFFPTFHRYRLDEPNRWTNRGQYLYAVWRIYLANGYQTSG